ncbi:hypothetical protein BC941DRAFT_459512 [Chlamydoabsidia padenii]|nr:hypothetical protein BC941DRAFT_459512 [Chlamydoabsidia padenii]
MTTLQQVLNGVPISLHCHKVVELIQSPSIKQNPTLFNHAIQYLRIKAIKGDVEAKVKLGTILDGQLLATVTNTQDDKDPWHAVLDKSEAAIWGKSLFDRWVSSALTPCLVLVESDLLSRQKNNDPQLNGSSNTNYFRLIDAILAHADDDEEQPTKNNRIKGDMCYLVGLMRLKGIGLEKDIELAVMYLTKASKLDHEGANYQLATMMEDQYNYPDMYNVDQSVALYEKMITSNKKKRKTTTTMVKSTSSSSLSTTVGTVLSGHDVRALIKLARVYYEGGELDKAYQYARKVAESTGEKYCQYMVGDILLQQKDIQQSLFWLTQSGQQGFPLAIEALARVYYEGTLIKQDYELAHEWCLKGDDIWPSGLGYCQSCLGDMYRQGLGVPKDQMKSFEYYQKAASQQDAPQNYARYMLGEM